MMQRNLFRNNNFEWNLDVIESQNAISWQLASDWKDMTETNSSLPTSNSMCITTVIVHRNSRRKWGMRRRNIKKKNPNKQNKAKQTYYRTEQNVRDETPRIYICVSNSPMVGNTAQMVSWRTRHLLYSCILPLTAHATEPCLCIYGQIAWHYGQEARVWVSRTYTRVGSN